MADLNKCEELLRDINYSLLKEQKEELLKVINQVPTSVDLNGLLTLIDNIQDLAVDYLGKDENEVFNLIIG